MLAGSHIFTKLLILAVLAFAIGAVAVAQSQGGDEGFDPDGSFWIYGKPPNEFEDFSGINLNAKHLRRLPAPGVDLTNGKNLRFKSLLVARNKFTFATVAIRGISYSFSGHFLKGGVFAAANLDQETPVLEGTLTKLKNGRKVAEAKLRFTYFGGT